MRTSIIGPILAAVLVLLLTACGNSQTEGEGEVAAAATAVPTEAPAEPTATSAPTETPMPPTATPFLPTATPVPPTATPVMSEDSTESEVFFNAVQQSAEVEDFRLEMDIAFSGAPPDFQALSYPANGDMMSLISMTGEVDGDNARITMNGYLVTFMGADPDQGLEMITVGNENYIRGPMPMLGALEDAWYVLDVDETEMSEFTTTPEEFDEMLESFQDKELADFNLEQTGSEKLDGQQCDVYTLGKEAILGLLQELDDEITPDTLASEGLETAEMKMWICDDGYFHQMEFVLEASPEGSADGTTEEKIGVNIYLHMYDFNSDITVAAPVDALPLELPTFDEDPYGFGTDYDDEAWLDDTATVFNGGNIRQEPSLQGQVLGQLQAGEEVLLHEKTADGRWYRVTAPAATGWVSETLLTIDPNVAARVPVANQAPAAVITEPLDPSDLVATVANGGNVRAFPSLEGLVVDQINAFETVQLLEKTSSGAWYRIVNERGVEGWVSVTLLTIDPAVANQVPVEGFDR